MMLNGRRLHSLCFLIVFAGASLLARRARADGSVNFDDRPKDTIIRNQYFGVGGAGLLFDGNPNVSGGGAHTYQGLVTPHQGSTPNVLISSSLDVEHTGRPLRGTFTTPQQTVSLWGGYFRFNSDPATKQGTLRVFNQAGGLITSATQTVTGNQSTAFFSATDPSGAHIYSFTLDVGADTYTTIDDLQFSGGTPMPPPPSRPVVHITDPPNQGFVDTTNGSSLLVDGTVDGANLLPDLAIELRLLTPPPPPQADNLPQALVQQGTLTLNGQNFGGPLFPNMIMGVYQLTVTATNGAGEGSATVTFTNLPAPLRQPDFQFGVPAGNCQIARFGTGGKAFFPATGAVISMSEAMITKWLAVKNYPILRHDGTLGCPTDIDRLLLRLVTPGQFENLGHAQNYERGRIYAMVGTNVYYTPKVFADAIDVISRYTLFPLINADGNVDPRTFNDLFGINEVGAPGSDPVTYIFGNDPTWLFQRFRRPGFTGEPNTLEVRGPNPNPKLYIERIGGGLVDYKAGVKREPAPGDITPAVWDVFQCSFSAQDQAWTCPVARHYLKSISTGQCDPDGPGFEACNDQKAVPLYTTESQVKDDMEFCAHNTPYCVFEHGCAQWSAIPETVDAMGVVHKPIVEEHPGETFPLGILTEEDTPSDHVDIQTMGWVQSSNNASTDLSWDHANIVDRKLGGFLGDACEGLFTLVGCGALECGAGGSIGDALCGGWADRVFHLRPLAQWIPDPNAAHLRLPTGVPAGPPFWNLLGSQASPANDTFVRFTNQLQNQGSSGDMEIEWENMWGRNFLAAGAVPQPPGTTHQFWGGTLAEPPPPVPNELDWPKVGSLAFVNGRWMLDCGHVVDVTNHHFHAEIHPINTLINSESAPAPVAMNVPGRVTKAQVWINQLYEGTPFHTKVWAPPRPSPQAEMNAMFVNYNGPGAPATIHNSDGSHVFSLTNYKAGNPAMVSPVSSTVTVALVGDGISVSVEGPPGTHDIKSASGQPMYPGDDPGNGSGTVGEFIGRWYVGWSCETLKFGNDFAYTCANIPGAL
jgi:hypothetical protein